MKKFILLSLIILFFSSCDNDDDGPTFYYEFMPIESVELPEYFVPGEVYTIDYTYYKPSDCYYYSDLYYDILNNTRTVAVINRVFIDSGDVVCTELEDELVEGYFQFHATSLYDSIEFKFWQGVSESGQNEYLIIEVPVEIE